MPVSIDRDVDSPAVPTTYDVGSTASAPAKPGQLTTVPQMGKADNAMSGLAQGLSAGMAMRRNAQAHADGGMITGGSGQLCAANAARASQKFRDYKK